VTEKLRLHEFRLCDEEFGMPVLERIFQTELYGTWTMRIYRMQERTSCKAIDPAGYRISCVVIRSAIATDNVAACIPEVWIVHTELRVVKNVESLGAKFEHAGLANRKVFQQAHVEVQTARIVQVVPTGISKRQSAWGNERTRILEEFPPGGVLP
jgi:hypothetical protein